MLSKSESAFLEEVFDADTAELVDGDTELEAVGACEAFEKEFRGSVSEGASDTLQLGLEVIEISGQKISQLELPETKTADPQFALWVLDRPKDELEARIRKRAEQMIEQGLIDETKALLERWPDARPLESVGYAQVVQYLKGQKPAGRNTKLDTAGLMDEITLATRQLCKRQRTWFNSELASQFFMLESENNKLQQSLSETYK